MSKKSGQRKERALNLLRAALFCFFAIPVCTPAQQVWDEMDVVDGPNPTLRYGFYTEPSGQLMMGRYYFLDDGETLRVRLAPFGKTAVELPVLEFDRDEGVLELGWEGKSDRKCRLQRHEESLFLGNCLEDLKVMPIVIRVANDYDVQWQGTYFPVSDMDIAILDKARQLLAEQEQRNRNGDRNCDDDISAGRFSVFCALYYASIEIAGTYRHRRPAIQAVRDELWDRFPGDYAHMLRDINNNTDISDAAFIETFDLAKARLLSDLHSKKQ